MDTGNHSPGEKSMLPADILFAILTDQDDHAEQILDWYDRYIRVTSQVSFDSQLTEDLAQEMRINLIASLPALRRRLVFVS